MKDVLLIITGSVSAFKSLELTRLLMKSGMNIKIVLSDGGEMFVTPLSASALSGNEVITKDTYKMEHIFLSRNADLILVCPASASFINKIACGIGGELALDIMLAKRSSTPVLICPAMNVAMWQNEAVVESIAKLKSRGFEFLEPTSGKLLCAEEGFGKLPSVQEIAEKVFGFFAHKKSLEGLKFVITNGGTIEKIDDVRYISNFSSGLQGALITKEILERGGEVLLIEGKTSYPFKLQYEKLSIVKVNSAIEMLEATLSAFENKKIDGFFAVAAVADFRVKNAVKGKIKKDTTPVLELEKNPDILEKIGNLRKNRPRKVIGFAAEEEQNLIKNGTLKLKKKNCDFIVANSLCFEMEETRGFIIEKEKTLPFSCKKSDLAKMLINEIFL
jgi:phosphopantothenoylcysteine decarboxylase/phosphopantothenate--cysteine ligase